MRTRGRPGTNRTDRAGGRGTARYDGGTRRRGGSGRAGCAARAAGAADRPARGARDDRDAEFLAAPCRMMSCVGRWPHSSVSSVATGFRPAPGRRHLRRVRGNGAEKYGVMQRHPTHGPVRCQQVSRAPWRGTPPAKRPGVRGSGVRGPPARAFRTPLRRAVALCAAGPLLREAARRSPSAGSLRCLRTSRSPGRLDSSARPDSP